MAKAAAKKVQFHPRNRAEWRQWLEKNHSVLPNIWLALQKKNSKEPGIGYEEAVEEALCFGWIDSLANSLDENFYLQFFSPRKSGSPWSQSNKERVQRLTKDGLMTNAGQLKIDEARSDGSWDKLTSIDNLEIPEDLQKVFNKNKTAYKNFIAFSPSLRKQILYFISSAKRPETRSKRINEIVELASKNQKPPQFDPNRYKK